MERTLTGWRKAGQIIDPTLSKTLRSQAFAVDVAERKMDPWQISNANRVLMELLNGYGLTGRRQADDPFDALMRTLGDDLDDNADGPGAAVRDSAH